MNISLSLKVLACRWMLGIFAILLIPTGGICKDQAATPGSAEEIEPVKPGGTEVLLTLTGYNYTNRYIDQFSADGQGGGNLFVSGPRGGGGGSACCVGYVIGARAWKVAIRWQVGACTFNEIIDMDGTKRSELHKFFKEVEVQIDPHIPARPHYLEVHFYPDGRVEAAITEHSAPPRLKLSKDREDRSHYKQCPNDKKPEQ